MDSAVYWRLEQTRHEGLKEQDKYILDKKSDDAEVYLQTKKYLKME